MGKAVPEQKREISDRARTRARPDAEAHLGASGADSDRQRRNRELAVILWVLASLVAEIEIVSWVFSHMYGT